MGKLITVCYNIVIGILLVRLKDSLRDKKDVLHAKLFVKMMFGFVLLLALVSYSFYMALIVMDEYRLAMSMNIIASVSLYAACYLTYSKEK